MQTVTTKLNNCENLTKPDRSKVESRWFWNPKQYIVTLIFKDTVMVFEQCPVVIHIVNHCDVYIRSVGTLDNTM